MKKQITLLLLLISFFLYACGKSESQSIAEEMLPNTEVTEENLGSDILSNVDTDDVNADDLLDPTQSQSKKSSEKSSSNDGIFNYFLPGGTSMHSGLYFNEPTDFFYNKNDSTNAIAYFEQADGEQIEVSSASPWDIERFNNYKDNGTWESPWEEKIESTNELDTPYGIVTVLSGYSDLLQRNVDNCFFDYIDVQWYIARKQGDNPKPMQEILNEMFSSKEITSVNDNKTTTSSHVDFSGEEYEYLLTDIDVVSADGDLGIKNVFGFNFPIEDSSDPITSGSSVHGMEDIASVKSFKFCIPEKDNPDYIATIEIPRNDITYLKSYMKTETYEEGKTVDYVGDIYEAKLISLQKKDVIDTKYGSAQIIYQTVSWTNFYDEERTREYELVLLDVNDYEILIKYEYIASGDMYQGILKDLLPQIIGIN